MGIIFGLKSRTFIRDKVLPNDPSPLGSRVSPKTERGARGCVVGWCGGRGVVVVWWCGGVGWAYYLFALWTMLGRVFSSF